MDVEQISWAAIPDNQEQIIRYAVLHRINVVYEYALLYKHVPAYCFSQLPQGIAWFG